MSFNTEKVTDVQVICINNLCDVVHRNSINKGWYEGPYNAEAKLLLMHAELSEGVEAMRHGNPPSDHVPEISGLAEELADTVIRICDFCAHNRIDLGDAIRRKHEFNTSRPHKHGGKAF